MRKQNQLIFNMLELNNIFDIKTSQKLGMATQFNVLKFQFSSKHPDCGDENLLKNKNFYMT